jgi:hypothetical protein
MSTVMSNEIGMTGVGSFRFLMDKLYELEQTIYPPDTVRCYRWQPVDSVDLPAMWNWVSEAPFRQYDQMRWIDDIEILVRVGIFHNEVDQDMALIEDLSDQFRFVVDSALYKLEVGPLQGAAYKAERTDMRNVGIELGGTPVFCMEFPIVFHVPRIIPPNQS